MIRLLSLFLVRAFYSGDSSVSGAFGNCISVMRVATDSPSLRAFDKSFSFNVVAKARAAMDLSADSFWGGFSILVI